MGLFGKSRFQKAMEISEQCERERAEKERREREKTPEQKDKDRAGESLRVWSEQRQVLSKYAADTIKKYVNEGTWRIDGWEDFLGGVNVDELRNSGVLHSLVLHTVLGAGEWLLQQMDPVHPEEVFRFDYPCHYALLRDSPLHTGLNERGAAWMSRLYSETGEKTKMTECDRTIAGCRFADNLTVQQAVVAIVRSIPELPQKDQSKAKDVLFALARKSKRIFNVIFLICLHCNWCLDLARVLRDDEDRFLDVVKLLTATKKWDDLIEWFRQNRKFAECVFVLEKAGRFKEAAAALEKLGPFGYQEFQPDGQPIQWTTAQQKDAYDRKLAQLCAFAAAAGQTDAKPTTNLEDRYAYGEISKAEYEKLKAQAASPTAKTCTSCGQGIEANDKFCRHCGGKC